MTTPGAPVYTDQAEVGEWREVTYATRHDPRPRLDPQAYPWPIKPCAICKDPIPVERSWVALDGQYVYDEATRLTCYSLHAEMYRKGEQLEEQFEVHAEQWSGNLGRDDDPRD